MQAFLNTHYDLGVQHGAEVLSDAPSLGAWLLAHGLIAPDDAVHRDDLARALALREALRELARWNGTERPPGSGSSTLRAMNAAAAGAPAEVRFHDGLTPVFVPAPGVSGGFGLLVAEVSRAMIDGSWTRLKICPGEDCGWAFFDHSRNGSGRWCSMRVCGGREKAKAHYRRRRQPRPGVAAG